MLTWTSECPGDGGEECWEEWQGWVVCLLLVLLISRASLRTDTGDPWVIKGGISRSRSVKEALGEVLVAYFFFKKLLRRLESRLLCEGDFFFLFTWFWAGMGLISDESSEMEKSPYVSLKEKARPLWLSVLQNSKHSLPMVGKSPSQGAIVRVLSWVKECLVRDLVRIHAEVLTSREASHDRKCPDKKGKGRENEKFKIRKISILSKKN